VVIDYPRIAGAGLLSVKPPADVALVSCGVPPFGRVCIAMAGT